MNTNPSYTAIGKIKKIEWEAPAGFANPHAVAVLVAIPAAQFAGFDLTRRITITQEEEDE